MHRFLNRLKSAPFLDFSYFDSFPHGSQMNFFILKKWILVYIILLFRQITIELFPKKNAGCNKASCISIHSFSPSMDLVA